MTNRLIFVLILTIGSNLYAQTSECRVSKASISGSYTGGCKNGLAHGKGIAQGTDRYEGQFVKGLPGGKGTYRWASGVYYEGEWKNGMREGEGKMVYPDSTVTGFWKEDKFQGAALIKPYEIITSMSVSRFTFTKASGSTAGVRIRVTQGGLDNISIEDFSLIYDSGSEYRSGNYYGIENVRFPLSVKVKYRSWNQLMTTQYSVIFEFVINQPGNWELVLIN
jgi:hypothetical protein